VLYWGVQSLRLQEVYSTDAMIVLAEQAAVEHGFVAKGDVVVMIAGLPLAITGVTNLIKAHRIGEQVAGELPRPRGDGASQLNSNSLYG
jgi:pyruvate kinase